MKILILAGKDADLRDLGLLHDGHECTVARLESVSRGVVRLEKDDADLVMLVPGPDDESWPRAVERVRREYGRQAVVLLSGPGGEQEALAKGAFDCFVQGPDTRGCLARSLRHLKDLVALEAELASERSQSDWMERTGVFGRWTMEAGGDIRCSDGLRRIFGRDTEPGRRLSGLREHVHPEDLEVFDRAVEATFDQGWPLDFEYRVVDPEGKTRHLRRQSRGGVGA
ncbi:PAS domain-containing protein [Desulfovibrio sp. Fe33]|uniref:PAS domain-containing protein n=1 Tax=Desulfovibrio sp. Fe33 TaxID=3020842 RepID=UPI00234C1161|nr:PAS domain-containing protein [Desulfovibrio sp. Fe33]